MTVEYEWTDGTPCGRVHIEKSNVVYVFNAGGKNKLSGYYVMPDGYYAGCEDMPKYLRIREVITGPDEIEEMFS